MMSSNTSIICGPRLRWRAAWPSSSRNDSYCLSEVAPRNAISGLQGVPRRRFVGSRRQACHEEASLMALAIDFALVVLGGEIDGHREFRLALQDLCRVRGGRDRVPHLRERGCKEGMMRVVRPCDPRKGLGGFGIFLGAIARAPEVAPETLWVVRVEAHRLLDPVDALLRRPSHVRSSPCCTTTRS